MNNIGTLYRYEIKKIVGKKLFWIMSALLFLLAVFTPFSNLVGSYYESGEKIASNLSFYKEEQAGKMALSGRALDDELFKEAIAAYSKVPEVFNYSSTEEYRKYALAYNEIYGFIRSSTGLKFEDIKNWDHDATYVYEKRKENIYLYLEDSFLTDNEIKFWKDNYEKLDKPFTYYYHDAYQILLDSFQTISIILFAFVSIVLSGVFANERQLKTEPIILASKKGKKETFMAKILAGITVSVSVSLILSIILFSLCLGYYTPEGFDYSLTVYFNAATYDISIGEACIIAYLIMQIALVLFSVFVMTLSEVLKNSVAALSVSMLLVILGGMISIPQSFRAIGQIWDWLPISYLAIWNMFDERTLPIFGKCILSWQIVPIIYIILSILLAFFTGYKYKKISVE